MDRQRKFYDFMEQHTICVISTLHDDGRPQSAVIGFGQTKDLQIIFGTDNSSRKYANLQRDPHVAFVIGWENDETIQYEGIARELKPEEIKLVRDNYWRKNPQAEVHNENPGERYFIVKPTWIRHTDLTVNPWHIEELQV